MDRDLHWQGRHFRSIGSCDKPPRRPHPNSRRGHGISWPGSIVSTVALGRRRYDCQDCEQPVRVYNSCGERHCPICSGSVRADWLERTAPTLVPQTEYLQIVFTIPAKLAELFLDNPARHLQLIDADRLAGTEKIP